MRFQPTPDIIENNQTNSHQSLFSIDLYRNWFTNITNYNIANFRPEVFCNLKVRLIIFKTMSPYTFLY